MGYKHKKFEVFYMKKILYTGLALVGAILTALSPANAQQNNKVEVKDVKTENVVTQNAKKGFVFSDILKNNKNFTLAGHYSHYSHSSHFSHSSHASHRSGW